MQCGLLLSFTIGPQYLEYIIGWVLHSNLVFKLPCPISETDYNLYSKTESFIFFESCRLNNVWLSFLKTFIFTMHITVRVIRGLDLFKREGITMFVSWALQFLLWYEADFDWLERCERMIYNEWCLWEHLTHLWQQIQHSHFLRLRVLVLNPSIKTLYGCYFASVAPLTHIKCKRLACCCCFLWPGNDCIS